MSRLWATPYDSTITHAKTVSQAGQLTNLRFRVVEPIVPRPPPARLPSRGWARQGSRSAHRMHAGGPCRGTRDEDREDGVAGLPVVREALDQVAYCILESSYRSLQANCRVFPSLSECWSRNALA
jgi:hypothetical protein